MFVQITNQQQNVFCAVRREFFKLSGEFPRHGRRWAFTEKLLRGETKILANIQKTSHGWQSVPVFNLIDVAFALPERKAHISGENALLHPQLRNAFRKPLNIIYAITSGCVHSINLCKERNTENKERFLLDAEKIKIYYGHKR